MDTFGRRLPFVGLFAVVAFGTLTAGMVRLQGDAWADVADDNALRTERLDATRGRVTDRNGIVVAAARPTVDLRITPSKVEDEAFVRHIVEPLLDDVGLERLDEAMAAEGLESHRTVTISRDVDATTRAILAARMHRLAGLDLYATQMRHYPADARMSHVVGYVSEVTADDLLRLDTDLYRAGDDTGRLGIERALETDLRGRPGRRSHVVDNLGRYVEGDGPWMDRLAAVAAEWDRPVVGGSDVQLTLDAELQRVAEVALDGRRGATVLMDVHTGAVLVYASSPDYDADELVSGVTRQRWRELQGDGAKPLLDRVSRGLYPPASTFKMVTAAAALEAGVSPHRTVRCTGSHQVGRRRFKCWKRGGHGVVDLAGAMAGSCDVWFYEVGIEIGHEAIADAAARFGLGSPTGVSLNGERAGLLPSEEVMRQRYNKPWTMGDTASASIGQSVLLVTPLQLAAMTATVANGGQRPVPYAIEQITHPDGTTGRVGGHVAPVDSGFDDDLLAHVRTGMEAVMSRGTGRTKQIDEMPFAGKTGTAQTVSARLKALRPGPETEDHALFVAYAPQDDPQVAIAVVLEHAGGGSTHAAPVARTVLEAWGIQQGLITPPEPEIDAEIEAEIEAEDLP